MEQGKTKVFYKKHIELNPPTSPSTGTITIYDGVDIWIDDKDGSKSEVENRFIEITDCYNKIRLHQSRFDTKKDWIDKLMRLQDTIDNYLVFLNNEKED